MIHLKIMKENTKTFYGPNGLHMIVPNTSKRIKEAVMYLEWMTNPEVLKIFAEWGTWYSLFK